MTTFDKREEGFEKKFAIDEELRFKATARRNKFLGLWAAEKLGLSGAEADAYAKDVVLADFEAYAAAQQRVDALFADADEWTRKSVINALSMGPFSSDRSVREYADNIWGIKPVL